jgi:hypothetical protein
MNSLSYNWKHLGTAEAAKAHTFIILHVDHHHSRGAAPTYNIIHNSSLASIFGTKQSIYCSDICTSSSPPGGWAELGAVAEAGAGGGTSLGCIVWRYTSMGGPSRIRKSTGVPADSCTLPGPRMPIEVLFVVSSLSCCNVSRSACRPWRMRSSRLPVTSGSQTRMDALVSQNGTGHEKERKEQIQYSRQRTQSASRDMSWRFDCAHRSKRQSTRMRCHSARTRINVGRCGPGRRRGSQHHMGAGRIPACLPGPLE